MSWIHISISLDLSTFSNASIRSVFCVKILQSKDANYQRDGIFFFYQKTSPRLHTFQNKTLQLISKYTVLHSPEEKTFEHLLLRKKQRSQQN